MVQETTYIETFDNTTITKDDIIDYLKSRYDNAYYNGLTKITDFTEGSEAYHLLDTIASLYLEAREDINDNYLMSMVHTQEGEFLDNTGDSLGVYRKAASPSTGYVIFYYNESKLTPTQILDDGMGTVCQLDEVINLDNLTVMTDDSLSFLTDAEEGTNLNGNRYVTVEAICEFEGEYTNVLEDTINLIDDSLPGMVRVTNLAFTGGEDIEDDDTYRSRILESPASSPVGSLNWYRDIAFIEDSGIGDLIHDIYPTKQGLGANEDLRLIYNPINKNETQQTYIGGGMSNITGTFYPSEYALRQFFALPEYDIVGVTLGYDKAVTQYVLADTTSGSYEVEYKIYCNIDTAEYPEATLETITPKVEAVITQFNLDANIGADFNPQVLCVLVEGIPEVIDAIIYQKATLGSTSTWGVVSEEISMDYDEVYQVSPDVDVIVTGPADGLVVVPGKSNDP